ncbi:hypothetical protein FK531_09255 [Rhodococcus spelaei]|uniref:Uncharacterized protein n=1 Tax=Rhodococcus spelaei TaxID=2546320 RepID=A0A541BMT4_9NOCA|nr:hypothetical protein [Rhodococcus spelaei]TQF73645.1 hypothetical protein FK531_09255 [Rhodococcus spelaei]
MLIERTHPTNREPDMHQSRRTPATTRFHSTSSPSRLTDCFELKLTSPLIDPDCSWGHVAAVAKVSPNHGSNLPYALAEIRVADPYVDADPATHRTVNAYIAGIEDRLRLDGFDPTVDRVEAMDSSEWNPYTKAWLRSKPVEGLAVWRTMVPSAEALLYLTNPQVGTVISNRRGDTATISPETVAHFRFGDDAIGIRDRGVAMGYLLADHFAQQGGSAPLDVLSLASGTADPVIGAAQRAVELTGRAIRLTVADIDGRALSMVRNNAVRQGFGGAVRTIRTNILDPALPDVLERDTGVAHFDLVENMGFEEYLPEDGDELGAFRGRGLPQASAFTRRAFDLVKPGGALLSGNMVLDRTQSDFVFGVVDWPLINARSEASIMRVYERAGLLGDPTVKIEMFRVRNASAGTHLYNIVKATKPDTSTRPARVP